LSTASKVYRNFGTVRIATGSGMQRRMKSATADGEAIRKRVSQVEQHLVRECPWPGLRTPKAQVSPDAPSKSLGRARSVAVWLDRHD
jgi:hypothetical protein